MGGAPGTGGILPRALATPGGMLAVMPQRGRICVTQGCGQRLKNKSESLEGDLQPLLVGLSPRGQVVGCRHLGIGNDRLCRTATQK